MAVIELPNSNSLEANNAKNSTRITRVFRVTGATTESQALLDPDIPLTQDAHPRNPRLRVAGFTVDPVPRGVNTWDVSVHYTASNPALTTHVTVERLSEPLAVFRINTPAFAIVFPGGIDNPTQGLEADIAGLKTDNRGQPVDFIHRTHNIHITYEIIGPPNERTLDQIQNKRNAKNWRGYRKGRVVYLGASTNYKGNDLYDITHSFNADPVFHLRQRPVYNSDGQLNVKDGHANTVNHWQPYPFTIDFAFLRIPAHILRI